MIEIEDSVIIKKPVDRVFKFATDLNNNAKWQSEILVAEQTSDGQFGLGATYRCVNRFLGKRIESEGVISDFEPDKICSFRFSSGSVSGESSYLFQPVNGYTKFTTVGNIKLNNFKLAALLVKRKARQQVRNDLKKLKQVLEGRQ
jgi:uncharacterized membrane protein